MRPSLINGNFKFAGILKNNKMVISPLGAKKMSGEKGGLCKIYRKKILRNIKMNKHNMAEKRRF